MRIPHRPRRPGEAEPYLSVVVTARNDDHGGNPLYRTQLFVDGLLAQCDRHRVPAELVIVEWNPPADRPRLAQMIDWPETNGYCTVRVIEVPPELHERLAYSDRLPLFQMIGKNVGIRRARGRFVLATNIDILFSDRLMRFVASRRFEEGELYRVNRSDVPADLDRSWTPAQQLAHCELSVMRVNMTGGTLDLRNRRFYWIYPEWRFMATVLNSRLGAPLCRRAFMRRLLERRFVRIQRRVHPSLGVSIGVFVFPLRLLRYAWRRVYGFLYWIACGLAEPRLAPQRAARRLRRIARAVRRAQGLPLHRLAAGIVAFPAHVVHRGAVRAHRDWIRDKARLRLHSNASGDFTLLARSDWERVGGYAEFQMYSMHIDGLFLYQAHYHGIREQVLRAPVYHIEHGGGFRPEAKGEDRLDAQLERRALPQLSTEDMLDWFVEMYESGAPKVFNDDHWGFAGEELPESTLELPGRRREMAMVNSREGVR